MPAPKPIKLTQSTAAAYDGAAEPQPMVIVGAGNVGQAGLVTKQSGIADQPNATTADLAAINSLTAKVNAILAALRSAGIIA